jgi:tetratricopeptide (TPR) repeat protein
MSDRRPIRWILPIVASLLMIALGVGIYRWWSDSQTKAIASACRMAIREEDWDKALPLAEQWVRRAPEDATAWLSMADVAKAKGDLVATAECLGRISPQDSRYLKSQMLRGDLILDGLGRPHDAVKVWREMLAVAPDAPVPHQRLLYVYSMTLQRKKLVAQIREAIQQKAEPPEAYGYFLAAPNLLFSDAYVRLGQWLTATPDDETLRVAQAIFAARTNPSRGIKMFGADAIKPGDDSGVRRCLKDYPRNLELRAFLIEQALAENNMTALSDALKDLPKEAEADCRFWRYIGTKLDFQRRYSEAAGAFRNSLKIHPMDWKSHHALGAVERVLGNAEAAARHADLGGRGKQLEREIHELPNAAQVGPELLQSLMNYADDCGEKEIAAGLAYRLNPQ